MTMLALSEPPQTLTLPDLVIVEVSGEPVPKGRPRFNRATGNAYTPAHTRKYEDVLRYAADQAMAGRPLFEGPVEMRVIASLPIPASYSIKKRDAARRGAMFPDKRPDWDNYGKIASDALNMVVFRDDSQIVDCHISKRYSDRPALRIEVRNARPAARDLLGAAA